MILKMGYFSTHHLSEPRCNSAGHLIVNIYFKQQQHYQLVNLYVNHTKLIRLEVFSFFGIFLICFSLAIRPVIQQVFEYRPCY